MFTSVVKLELTQLEMDVDGTGKHSSFFANSFVLPISSFC